MDVILQRCLSSLCWMWSGVSAILVGSGRSLGCRGALIEIREPLRLGVGFGGVVRAKAGFGLVAVPGPLVTVYSSSE